MISGHVEAKMSNHVLDRWANSSSQPVNFLGAQRLMKVTSALNMSLITEVHGRKTKMNLVNPLSPEAFSKNEFFAHFGGFQSGFRPN